MTRKKVKLMWIANEAARKASLKKRRIGLLKKVSELTTLCGVRAFAIIYSPDENEPAVWPSHPTVQQLMIRFQNKPEIERCKKMMNQESYLKERINKVKDQCKKHQRKNKELEMAYLMHHVYQGKGIDEFDLSELHGFAWLVEEKMKEIRKRVEYFQHIPPLPPPSIQANLFSPLLVSTMEEAAQTVGGGGNGGDGWNNPTEAMQWDQWLMDILTNNDHIDSHGGTRIDHLAALPLPYSRGIEMKPQYELIGGCSNNGNGHDLNMIDFNISHGNIGDNCDEINSIDAGLPQGDNGRNDVFSFPQGNIECSNDEHSIMMGLPYHINTGVGDEATQVGMQGCYGGAADSGLPCDAATSWFNYFSP